MKAVTSGEGVTVSPLDGSQSGCAGSGARGGWKAVNGGAQLDGLASIRLEEAGGDRHPQCVAGLLRAVTDNWDIGRRSPDGGLRRTSGGMRSIMNVVTC